MRTSFLKSSPFFRTNFWTHSLGVLHPHCPTRRHYGLHWILLHPKCGQILQGDPISALCGHGLLFHPHDRPGVRALHQKEDSSQHDLSWTVHSLRGLADRYDGVCLCDTLLNNLILRCNLLHLPSGGGAHCRGHDCRGGLRPHPLRHADQDRLHCLGRWGLMVVTD